MPNQGPSDRTNEISINGSNFAPSAVVSLNATLFASTWINGNQLLAVVPTGLAVSTYDLVVTNPDKQRGVLAHGYTVFDRNNDDLFSAADELWSSPIVPKVGEAATIGLLVHRRGGKAVLPNVKVRFLLGNGSGALLGEAAVPDLDPVDGFDITLPVTATFTQPGEVVVTAIIDPDNLIPEDNESNNIITRTLTVAPPGTDHTPPVVNNISVNEGATQTTAPTVNLTTAASDPGPNASGMEAVYLIEYIYNTALNQWIPRQRSSLLPYAVADLTPQNYAWTLNPVAGMHYLQVRARDKGGNISVGRSRALISYAPPSDHLERDQTRIYRYTAAAGQQLHAQLTVLNGDADLYVWSSNPAQSAHVSNAGTPNEVVLILANEIVPGTYQVEVYGFSTTDYRLDVTISTPPGSGVQAGMPLVHPDKVEPTAPVLPVSNTPDDRQGAPPPSTTIQTASTKLFLPLVKR